MICPNCNKSSKSFLILYRGSLVCKHCLKKLVNTSENMNVLKESEDIFKLAKASFLKVLTSDSNEQKAHLEHCVEFCRKACEKGNINAFSLMAKLYHYNYINENLTVKQRILIAYEYYSKVCFNDVFDNEVNCNIAAVRTEAANNFLELMSSFAEGSKISERFTFEFVYHRLVEAGITNLRKRSSIDVVDNATTISVFESELEDFTNLSSKSLMSLFRLKGKDIFDLLNRNENILFDCATSGNVYIKYYINYGGEFETKLITNRDQYSNFYEVLEQNKEEQFIFIIINRKYKYKFFSSNQFNNIKTTFSDNIKAVDDVVDQKSAHDYYSLYEDDLYYLARGKKINPKLTDDFTRYILEGDIENE